MTLHSRFRVSLVLAATAVGLLCAAPDIRAESRIVDEPIVDVPADCPGESEATFGCRQERRFSRVYVLEFSFERRDSRGTQSHIEVEDRGQISLFLHFESSDRREFDDELREELANLAADAFAENFAGMGLSSGVFSTIARRSLEPSWSCFEHGSTREAKRYERYVERGPDGTTQITGSGWSGYDLDAVTGPLCEAGSATVHSVPSEEIRTMPVARALLETTVSAGFADGLRGTSYPEDLMALPLDLTYTIQRDPGVGRSESVHKEDGLVSASFSSEEMKISATASAAMLEARFLSTNAWVARWTVETVERRMGPMPAEEFLDRSDLLVALLPTLPPSSLDEEGNPGEAEFSEAYAIDFDANAFLEEIAERLDETAAIDVASLERAVADYPAGLRSSGWLLALCRPDGSADYRLLPTKAVAPVESAAVFCTAVERRLSTEGFE
jgi:hypothetical protein